jgi:hypothetical protein
MRATSTGSLGVLIIVGAMVSGCDRASASEGGAPAARPAEAIDAIVKARCAREQRCGEVGHGKEWMSAGACAAQLRIDLNVDLNTYNCPRGVAASRLNECVADARDEACGNPIDAMARIMSCRVGHICQ